MPQRTRSQPQIEFAGLDTHGQAFGRGPGTLRRISNLLYDPHGGLKTVAGTLRIFSYGGAVQTDRLPWLALHKVSRETTISPPVTPEIVGLVLDADTALSVPSAPSLSPTISGSLGAGTYYYATTAVDGRGVETTISAEASLTINGTTEKGIDVASATVANAVTYNSYGRATGVPLYIGTAIGTFNDDGTITPAGAPSVANNTSQLSFVRLPADGNWGSSNVVKRLPGTWITDISTIWPIPGKWGTGTIGSSIDTTNGQVYIRVNGDSAGASSPIPQILSFADKILVLLGNGANAQVWDLSVASPALNDLTNTFTVSYPGWLAASAYLVGDIIEPATPNAHIYICTQGGTSAGAAPTFPTITDAVVSDAQVVWKEHGSTAVGFSTQIAHGAIFRGSFWAFNISSNKSLLAMSDSNNPLSWNPLNQAHLDKDDGDSGMGLVPFAVAEAGIAPEGALVAFKTFKTFLINGSFPNVSISLAKTDKGCIAPRSALFVAGHGIIRLTHQGVAVFDGVQDRIISHEIAPYIFPEEDDIPAMDFAVAYFSKAFLADQPYLYCLLVPTIATGTNTTPGAMTRILAYDLHHGGWGIIDLPVSYSAATQIRSIGTIPISILGSYSDGTIRRILADDPDWEEQGLIQWSFRSPDFLGGSTAQAAFAKGVILRALGAGIPTSAQFRIDDDTTKGITTPMKIVGGKVGARYEARASIGKSVMNANVEISGAGPVEINSLEWEVVDQPSGTLSHIG